MMTLYLDLPEAAISWLMSRRKAVPAEKFMLLLEVLRQFEDNRHADGLPESAQSARADQAAGEKPAALATGAGVSPSRIDNAKTLAASRRCKPSLEMK